MVIFLNMLLAVCASTQPMVSIYEKVSTNREDSVDSTITAKPADGNNELRDFDIIAVNGAYSYTRQKQNSTYFGDYFFTTTILSTELTWKRFFLPNIAAGATLAHFRRSFSRSYEGYSNVESYSMVGPIAGYYWGKKVTCPHC